MKLYRKFMALHLKNDLEYKASFIINFITQSIVFFATYFVILALFNKFGILKDYTIYQILLVYACIQFGFSINKIFNRGFDNFEVLIRNGELDRMLTRPRNIYVQILGSDIDYSRSTRTIQSIIILFIAIANLDIVWSFDKILTLIFMLISSCVIFFNIFLLGAAFCFVTIQGIEVKNVFTDGGREMAQYPMDIYKKEFRLFFTYIIPFGLVNYYPLHYIIGKSDNPLFIFLPLLVFLYTPICVFIFNKAIKKYTSTGS